MFWVSSDPHWCVALHSHMVLSTWSCRHHWPAFSQSLWAAAQNMVKCPFSLTEMACRAHPQVSPQDFHFHSLFPSGPGTLDLSSSTIALTLSRTSFLHTLPFVTAPTSPPLHSRDSASSTASSALHFLPVLTATFAQETFGLPYSSYRITSLARKTLHLSSMDFFASSSIESYAAQASWQSQPSPQVAEGLET